MSELKTEPLAGLGERFGPALIQAMIEEFRAELDEIRAHVGMAGKSHQQTRDAMEQRFEMASRQLETTLQEQRAMIDAAVTKGVMR